PYNEYQHTGDGFSFKHFTGNDLLNVLKYAMYIYYYKKPEWKLLMKNAMSCDVSWDNSAKKYIELFEEISK
ncbi:MAG: starch synthase, partial [Erysipelotrichaceae bacterium]|nr:starch synthase [Erysipelotrichaceae bacterium]